jgi:aldose 1-epimerase
MRSEPSLLSLMAGDLVLDLAPAVGGSVASFRMRRPAGFVNLMRSMAKKALADGNTGGAAMFPMVPFANRIIGNRFDFRERTYQLQPNVAGEAFAIHGSGWQSKWTVSAADATSAELRLEHPGPDGPYAYSAIQRFHLHPDHLKVTTSVTNRGNCAMPFGLGQHPAWDREAGVTLRFRSTHYWLGGSERVATERIATPPELDFSTARHLPPAWRDNCYGGWDGRAEITFPQSGVGIRMNAAPLFQHLMLYCDPAKPFFCLEPQTHAAGALNRLVENNESNLGLIELEPGNSVEAEVSFICFLL